ncbi:hypothetical protein H2201_007309 [Coniosporium apollinis]|uniref:Helicase ATP-binding domain-containing protein n=1 Tax=Coniosporium apollinis TaxID=61459 RepID=A0ABQ9NM01_9PEZI|nr:hypothetical protein H2201_007309 [Coniosporium apollinis]
MATQRAPNGDAVGDASDGTKNWYYKLLSRRVDLVGDYAGNELFLIEGDSLLLNAFSDDKLDFTDGFQLLHAVYNVENFLQNLLRRKCNFHVAFFDEHEECCIPPFTPSEDKDKYLLARAAIIRHLQKNIGMTQSRLSIKTFSSVDCSAFAKYLEQTGLYFIMCHDGAVPVSKAANQVEDVSEDSDEDLADSDDDDSEDEDSEDDATSQEDSDDEATEDVPGKNVLRHMIFWCIRRGYNVALVNGLEWRDTKVITVVLEGHSTRHAGYGVGTAHADSTPNDEDTASNGVSSSIQKLVLKVIGISSESWGKFTERECLAVITVAKMLSEGECEAHTASKFLLHIALLHHYVLTERRLAATKTSDSEEFLQEYASRCLSLMKSWEKSEMAAHRSMVCDVADLLDGRLFNACMGLKDMTVTDDKIEGLLEALINATVTLCGVAVPNPLQRDQKKRQQSQSTADSQHNQKLGKNQSVSVLPFNNPVFDTHLVSVQLSTDDTPSKVSGSALRVFRELSHWHNAKRPLDRKIVQDPRQAFYAARRNQRFMAEMMAYAASLTNAVGNALEPETVVTGSGSGAKASTSDSKRQELQNSAKQTKADSKPNKKGTVKPPTVKERIAAERAVKDDANADKHLNAWYAVCKTMAKEQDPGARYFKTKEYLNSLTGPKRAAVEAEVQLFMLDALLSSWIRHSKDKKKQEGFGVAALLWSTITDIAKVKAGLTKTVATHVQSVVKRLGLPAVSLNASASADRQLPFAFSLDSHPSLDISLPMTPKNFQLLHCGPFFDRNIDSAPDSRVPFEPDGWQRKVLDEIDAKRSLFVVAPTSAGKTFISFYAMKQILESGDDDVLVYVAPTKALVNQIAAEVQARFSKSFKYGGKSVWGIHTRDYRINNPTGCQVLVTVPHILQIMLLAPSNANSWSRRVKRIIFDEIHCIGQAEDGIVWEQLLLLAPCPIIALSATVGNPEEFNSWVASTQRSINIDLTMIQHHQRYSDLRKFIYNPPKNFTFNGLAERPTLAPLGLDGAAEFAFMHPVASLVNR